MTEFGRFVVYSRRDEPLYDLGEEIVSATRTEEVNGEHRLDIVTTQPLAEGMRILRPDRDATLREWVVDEPDFTHDGSAATLGTYGCTWSMQYDLAGTYGGERWAAAEPGTHDPIPAQTALSIALAAQARWEPGRVTVGGVAGCSLYDGSVWDYLGKLVETWGGEIEPRLEFDSSGVLHRYVDWLAAIGSHEATRRFDYGIDCTRIRRTPAAGPRWCGIVPRGGSSKTDEDGVDYSDRIGIEDAPRCTGHAIGSPYLYDPAAQEDFKRPDGHGGWEYPCKVVTFSLKTEQDEEELLELARAELYEHTRPETAYEADVAQFAAAGMDVHGVGLGDVVHVVDRAFGTEPLRLEARVTKVVTNELDPADVRLTVGSFGSLAQSVRELVTKGVSSVSDRVGAIEEGGTLVYLRTLVAQLNAEINATGGYTYVIDGVGLRTYDKAVTDPLAGDEADRAVEIRGGAIRIADSKDEQGMWEWRSVFVAGHVAAELVTAAQLTSGYIGDPSGANFWNLDTGQLRIASDAQIADRTVAQMLEDFKVTDLRSLESNHSQQAIYRSAPQGTASMQGTNTWVSESGPNVQGRWTTTRPTYDTAYPVLFIAVQRRTVEEYISGRNACSCTAPVKDDTTTVIDGGHITTGTIDASNVNVVNLDASNITAGILHDRTGENSWNLDTGEFQLSGMAVEVGGTQWLNGTENFSGWGLGSYWSVLGEVATCDTYNRQNSTINIDHWVLKSPRLVEYQKQSLPYASVRGYRMTFSMEAISYGVNPHSILDPVVRVAFTLTARGGDRKAYINRSFTLAVDAWKRYSCTVDLVDSGFTRMSGTTISQLKDLFLEVWVYNRAQQRVQIRRCKLERGDTPTDWCRSEADRKGYAEEASKAEVEALDAALDQEKMFNRLTKNGTVKAITRTADGKLYINGTYISANTLKGDVIRAGLISDKKGKVKWNLDTGAFSTTSMTASSSTLSGKLVTTGKSSQSCSRLYDPASWTRKGRSTGTIKKRYIEKSQDRKLTVSNGVIGAYAVMDEVNSSGTKVIAADQDILLSSIDMLSAVGLTVSSGVKITCNAFRLYSRDIMRIITPALYVAHTGDRGATGTQTLNKTVKLKNILYKAGGKQKTGTVTLKFIHGMLVKVSGPTDLVEQEQNEWASIRTRRI